MATNLVRHNRPIFDHVHPRIFTTAIGLVAWFVVAAWILFDHKFDSVADVALPLGMASALLFFTVLLLSTLTSMTNRHVLPRDGVVPNISFHTGSTAISRSGAAASRARMPRSISCCRWRRPRSASPRSESYS